MTEPILLPLFDALRGPRVTIRPYEDGDAQGLYDAVAASRDHIRPWLPFADAHQTVEASLVFIRQARARWIIREDGNLALIANADGHFLGGIGMHPRNWDLPAFEIGYWLRVDAEGQGYMVEAVRLLTRYLLEDLGAQRVMIRCDEHNTRSANVARRLGFAEEGRLRNAEPGPNGPRTMLYFARVPGDPPLPA